MALGLVIVTSCTDAVSPASRAPGIDATTRVTAHVTGNLTVTSDNGISYTLYEAEKTVHTSNGEVFVLNDDQFEKVRAAMATTLSTDLSAQEVYIATGYYYNCVAGTAYCGEQWLRAPEDPTLPAMRPKWSTARSLMRRSANVRIALAGRSPLPGRSVENGGLSARPYTAYMLGGICDDIAHEVVGAYQSYRNNRTTYLDKFKEWGTWQIVNGVLEYAIGIGTGGAATFDIYAGESIRTAVTTGWLAWLWNTYSCANRTVNAGTFYMSQGGYSAANPPPGAVYIGVGQYGAACFVKQDAISVDGGATYHSVNVTYCYLN